MKYNHDYPHIMDISWLAHVLIVAIYLSIPFGTKIVVWFAFVGSIVGWISIFLYSIKKYQNDNLTGVCNFFLLWFAIGGLYLILHAVQISSLEETRRLDSPARMLLLSGLIVLPLLANKKIQDYLLPLTLSGIIFGLISIYQIAINTDAGRYFGFYDYHNLMALAALVNMIILLFLLNEEKVKLNRYLILSGMLGSVIACLSSGTRASWVLIIIATGLNLLTQRNNALAKRSIAVLLAILFFVGSIFIMNAFDARIQSTLVDINKISNGDHSGSIGLRVVMAEMALNKILLNPITGNGLSDFHQDIVHWADINKLPSFAMERGFQNSHNQFLHWAQSLGIPCAILLIYFIIFWPLQVAKKTPGMATELLKTIIFICALFFFTEAVLDRHHGSTWFAIQIGLMLGFVLHVKKHLFISKRVFSTELTN